MNRALTSIGNGGGGEIDCGSGGWVGMGQGRALEKKGEQL